MNAGIGKLCTRFLKGHVVWCNPHLCYCRVLKISWKLRRFKENLPFNFFCKCSILHAFLFLIELSEKKLVVVYLPRNKTFRRQIAEHVQSPLRWYQINTCYQKLLIKCKAKWPFYMSCNRFTMLESLFTWLHGHKIA